MKQSLHRVKAFASLPFIALFAGILLGGPVLANTQPSSSPQAPFSKAIKAIKEARKARVQQGSFLKRSGTQGHPGSYAAPRNARTTVALAPDSVIAEEYSGGTFTESYRYKLVRNSSGLLTQIRLWTPPLPPLPNIQMGSGVATYTPQGSLTRLSFFELFPAQNEIFRWEQPFNAQGHCTSAKIYESPSSGGSLELTEGDSMVYTYSGSTITSFVVKYFDAASNDWLNGERCSSITYNASGHPTSFVFQYWDDSTSTWTDDERITNVTWNFGGFSSWASTLLDGYAPTVESSVLSEVYPDIPRLTTETEGYPDQYTLASWSGSTFVDEYRSVSTLNAGKVQQMVYSSYDPSTSTWNIEDRQVFSWSGNLLLSSTYQEYNSSVYTSRYRERLEYTPNGDWKATYEEDSSSTGWRSYRGEQNLITYQPGSTNRILNWTEMDFQFFGGYDTLNRYTLFYSQGASACPGCVSPSTAVYPNPFSGRLWISETEAGATVEVRDLSGRLVWHQVTAREDALTASVDTDTWPAGMYTVMVKGKDGVTRSQKVIKH